MTDLNRFEEIKKGATPPHDTKQSSNLF